MTDSKRTTSTNSQSTSTTDPGLVARLRGKHIIRQELGDLRSFASQAAHQCAEIDEEEFFAMVAENYVAGIKNELSNIFGATKAARMLDPFKHNG